MELKEAIASRYSARAFLDRPVSLAAVQRILEGAAQSPSGGNLQPWHVDVLAGPALKALIAEVVDKLPTQPKGEPPEFPIYPEKLKEPYRTRRFECGEDLYAAIGIPREDRPARLRQFARNLECFGAPVALFFSLDRTMGVNQWAHLGMMMQTVMLLAREEGLDTCAQEAWSVWHETVARHIDLPPERQFFCGMALGYADEAAPINQWRTRRAELSEWTRFHGFSEATPE
ncbi:MAG: nitroreductase [Pseudomonadota bacterium]